MEPGGLSERPRTGQHYVVFETLKHDRFSPICVVLSCFSCRKSALVDYTAGEPGELAALLEIVRATRRPHAIEAAI